MESFRSVISKDFFGHAAKVFLGLTRLCKGLGPMLSRKYHKIFRLFDSVVVILSPTGLCKRLVLGPKSILKSMHIDKQFCF